MTTEYDVIIVGGGLGGLSAALACNIAGLKSALVAKKTSQSDGRTTALFMPSIDFLDDIGIWQELEPQTAALKTMRILDGTKRLVRSRPAAFHSNEIGLETFGYNIPNQAMFSILEKHIDASDISVIDDVAIDYTETDRSGEITLSDRTKLTAKHVIAADGRNSLIREKSGIKHRSWTYQQKAIVLSFSHKFSHQNISTEFHTEDGPFTQVPLPGNRSSLVWAVADGGESELLSKPINELNLIIEEKLHSILGPVEIDTKLQCFPLSSLLADRFSSRHALLVGEAAHAFPPIGAQGLNLGLRDVITAIECITGQDGDNAASDYDKKRRADIVTRTFGIDMFNRTLLTSFLPVQLVRSGAIAAVSSIPLLRQLVMRQGAMPGKPSPNNMREGA